MKSQILKYTLLPLLLFSSTLSYTDDTEIYLGAPQGITVGEPLVMLTIDYRPSLFSAACNGYDPTEGVVGGVFTGDAGNLTSTCAELFALAGMHPLGHPAKRLDALRAALNVVLNEIVDSGKSLSVGLMIDHDWKKGCEGQFGAVTEGCSNGAYVLQGFTHIDSTPQGKTNLQYVTDKLGVIPDADTGSATHKWSGAEIFFELFRYLTGQAVWNAHNGYLDYGTNDDTKNLNDPDNDPVTSYYPNEVTLSSTPTSYVSGVTTNVGYSWDESIETLVDASWDTIEGEDGDPDIDVPLYKYISPVTENCSKIFTINFFFGVENQAKDSNDEIEKPTETTGAPDYDGGFGVRPSNNKTSYDVIKFMYDADLAYDSKSPQTNKYGDPTNDLNTGEIEGQQNVTSYFFAYPNDLAQANAHKFAEAGGTVTTRELSEDPDEVLAALESVFAEILSISTTFVSATVPVNVFTRSEDLDNAYFGVFQPELNAQWPGNVKRLRIYTNPNDLNPTLEVLGAGCDTSDEEDQTGTRSGDCRDAVSATDGRILGDILTFWTDSTKDDVQLHDNTDDNIVSSYWDPDGPRGEVDGEFAGTDGKSVDRGGAGQQIPELNLDNDNYTSAFAPSVTNVSGSRQLFTTTTSNGTSVIPLNGAAVASNNPGDTTGLSSGKATIPSTANTTAGAIFDEIKEGLNLDGIASWNLATNYVPDVSTPNATLDPISDINSNGVGDQTDVLNLILFMRGIDTYDIDGDDDTTESRPWTFADILHTQPAVINFGASGTGYNLEDNQDIRILTSSNDGYIRMLRNSLPSASPNNHVGAGNEIWAFMPHAAMGVQGTIAGNAETDHPYGVDGGISVYTDDVDNDKSINPNGSDSDTAIAYFAMRRGGNAVIALDISDPTATKPTVKWIIDSSSTGLSELGQSWSKPTVTTISYDDGTDTDPKPVVIFAGGYDEDKDDDSDLSDDLTHEDDEGNAVYVVNALTGELIWKAVKGASTTYDATNKAYTHTDLVDSIPSDVTIVDYDDDLADTTEVAYVGDTGGVLWRIDMRSTNTSNWTIAPILSVGRHSGDTDADGTSDEPDRRFFHAPDAVRTTDSSGSDYEAVLIGSGNRAHPKEELHTDQFYMVRDYLYDPNDGGIAQAAVKRTPDELADLTAFTCTTTDGDTTCEADNILDNNLPNGWFIDMEASGEKVLTTPLTDSGVTFFGTYVPSGGAGGGICEPQEGSSFFYAINLADATPAFDFNTSEAGFERSTYSGDGIGGSPIKLNPPGGGTFVVPGNIPPDIRQSTGLGKTSKTLWYEIK